MSSTEENHIQGKLRMTFRIIVACGAGIATSSAVLEKLKTELEARGIRAEFENCKILDAITMNRHKHYDLLVSTTQVPPYFSIPYVSGVPFLTGVGIDEAVAEIIKMLKKRPKEIL
jgi:PTS system galactitol-specific IIB component